MLVVDAEDNRAHRDDPRVPRQTLFLVSFIYRFFQLLVSSNYVLRREDLYVQKDWGLGISMSKVVHYQCIDESMSRPLNNIFV